LRQIPRISNKFPRTLARPRDMKRNTVEHVAELEALASVRQFP
jgi:hypothetical protein